MKMLAGTALKHRPVASDLANVGAELVRVDFVWRTMGDATKEVVGSAMKKWREVKFAKAVMGIPHGHPLGPSFDS